LVVVVFVFVVGRFRIEVGGSLEDGVGIGRLGSSAVGRARRSRALEDDGLFGLLPRPLLPFPAPRRRSGTSPRCAASGRARSHRLAILFLVLHPQLAPFLLIADDPSELLESVLRLRLRLLRLEPVRVRRRIGRLLEPHCPEVLDAEVAARRLPELLEPFLERDVSDLDDLDDLLHAPPKVVHPRREEETRSADPSGSATGVHPISFESLDESDGVGSDLLGLVLELEEGGETRDVEGGVHDGKGFDVKDLYKFEVGGA
jgi:hypothetical protein